ncbi:hypothetical protein NI454_02950 [Brevundimonas diminuta]|uniref:hypothetical protein n=1 Tax=Brevundimonas TaxID=41275 RepID=UPI0020974BCD|nr:MULTISPECIES: hypothetical protein [Brevundimonas]MCO8028909.1 hypothetical protein [Brevundimonas diminuta]
MTKVPHPPPEQRSFADRGHRPMDEAAAGRRHRAEGVQSDQPGDADVNLGQQGRFGNLHQNLTTRRMSHP